MVYGSSLIHERNTWIHERPKNMNPPGHPYEFRVNVAFDGLNVNGSSHNISDSKGNADLKVSIRKVRTYYIPISLTTNIGGQKGSPDLSSFKDISRGRVSGPNPILRRS